MIRGFYPAGVGVKFLSGVLTPRPRFSGFFTPLVSGSKKRGRGFYPASSGVKKRGRGFDPACAGVKKRGRGKTPLVKTPTREDLADKMSKTAKPGQRGLVFLR